MDSSESAAARYGFFLGGGTPPLLGRIPPAAVVARASSRLGSAGCRCHERRADVAAKISVLTFPISRRARFRFVSCETLPIFSESLRQKWPEWRRQAAQRFWLRLRR